MKNQYAIVEHPSGAILIDLYGRYTNIDAVEVLNEEVENFISKGKRTFVLDLNNVEYMNSSGLNLLLRIFTKIRNKGGDMLIINPSESVEKLLSVSKLNTVFSIYADVETAINSLNAPEA